MTSLEIEIFSVPREKRIRRAATLRRLADKAELKNHRNWSAMADQLRLEAHMEDRLAALY